MIGCRCKRGDTFSQAVLIGRGLDQAVYVVSCFYQFFSFVVRFSGCLHPVGVYYDEVPPVPFPNTEVKLICAENTWRVAARENRSSPTSKSLRELIWFTKGIYSSIAQLVEHAAVNRRVVGSSPTWGAIWIGAIPLELPLAV